MDSLDRECSEAIARDDFREERRARALGKRPNELLQDTVQHGDTDGVERSLN